MTFDVQEYIDKDGRSPYREWLAKLRDNRARIKVIRQVDRMELGNFGDAKPVGEGVSETRIDYGPGYRIYHAKVGNKVIILLSGGDKSTQNRDIKTAKVFLADYKKGRYDT